MTCGLMRSDHVVPCAMELAGLKVDLWHVFLGDGPAGGIRTAIESAGHGQSFRGRRLRDEMDHRLVVTQWLAAPVRGNEGKEAVLDRVPRAGAGREMTDRKGQADVVREWRQLECPQAPPPAIATAAVSRHHDRRGRRIEPWAFMVPPTADGRDRTRARVMIGPDLDKPGVPPDVITPLGIGPRHVGRGKVVPAHLRRLFRGKPWLAGVRLVTDAFLLLGVDRDHRTPVGQAALHAGIDVATLRVAVRGGTSLLGLPVALEAVVEPVQQLRHLHVADRMMASRHGVRQASRALARPSPWRFRGTSCVIDDPRGQRAPARRVGHPDRLAPRARTADPTGRPRGPRLNLADTVGDRPPRQSARTTDDAHAARAHGDRVPGRHEAPCAFVQQRPHPVEFRRQSGQAVHVRAAEYELPQLGTVIYERCLTTARSFSARTPSEQRCTRLPNWPPPETCALKRCKHSTRKSSKPSSADKNGDRVGSSRVMPEEAKWLACLTPRLSGGVVPQKGADDENPAADRGLGDLETTGSKPRNVPQFGRARRRPAIRHAARR